MPAVTVFDHFRSMSVSSYFFRSSLRARHFIFSPCVHFQKIILLLFFDKIFFDKHSVSCLFEDMMMLMAYAARDADRPLAILFHAPDTLHG